MFEYHGWATLLDSVDDTAESASEAADGLSRHAFDAIRDVMAPVRVEGWQTADIRVVNASAYLWLAGKRNHKQDAVIDAYRAVAELTPWSYGTLYVWDDELPGELGNRWTVWVMKRGEIAAQDDLFLSPHTPAR